MRRMRGGSVIARVLASFVLASFLLSSLPPAAHAARGDPMSCTEHHPLPSGPAIDSAAHLGGCDPGAPAACRSMPGCAAPAPALAAPVVPLLPWPAPLVTELTQAMPLIGLAALGPPTPPPNS